MKENLFEIKVLTADPSAVSPDTLLSLPLLATGLTFDQQKELFMLQLEHDKFKLRVEVEKELEVEKMRQRTEQAKLEMEQARLEVIKEGKLLAGGGFNREMALFFEQCLDGVDILGNLRLLPTFLERDLESFISLFECVADARGWQDSAGMLMLQYVLTGRAQEVYSSLIDAESQKYSCEVSCVEGLPATV